VVQHRRLLTSRCQDRYGLQARSRSAEFLREIVVQHRRRYGRRPFDIARGWVASPGGGGIYLSTVFRRIWVKEAHLSPSSPMALKAPLHQANRLPVKRMFDLMGASIGSAMHQSWADRRNSN